jgi:hypothetical protein
MLLKMPYEPVNDEIQTQMLGLVVRQHEVARLVSGE